MSMYLIINIIGLIVFLGIGWLFSKNRKEINWKTVGIMVVLNLLLAWFLVSSAAGRAGVKALMVLLGLLMSLQKELCLH